MLLRDDCPGKQDAAGITSSERLSFDLCTMPTRNLVAPGVLCVGSALPSDVTAQAQKIRARRG
jgi:hypothetical protein